jgi:DNA-directed RNA polymerase subunit RPC12/RpoP
MASDSEGRFGHQCPECTKHFRTANIPSLFPLTCPYCGLRAESFRFLTPPQLSYVRHYLATLQNALGALEPANTAEVDIDMDAISDTVTDAPWPDFYYTSIAQQTQFDCSKCGGFNDVRGRYVYCASCGWRNNAALLKETMSELRDRLNTGAISPEDAVKQAVSAFDACGRNFVDQLETRVAMKASRRAQVKNLLFHNLDRIDEVLKTVFDINITAGLRKDRALVRKMFLRRHVYEHDGGVTTGRYIEQSGDTEVEEGMLIRESVENVHILIGALIRMTDTLDADFHEIFPPEPFCIELKRNRKERERRSNR